MTITRGLPFSSYLALPSAHFSALKELDRSPAHYLRAVEHGRKDTDALRMGRAVDALVLTPDLADVAVWERERKVGAEWKLFKAANATSAILTVDERDRAFAMCRAVHGHKIAGALIQDGDAQITIEWTDPTTGIACRARVDFLRSDGGLVELKTAKAVHPRAFERACASYLYHAQVAFYTDGLVANGITPPSAHIIAVEKTPPHDVCVYRVGEDVLEVGRRKYHGWLARLAECQASGRWPGAGGDEVVELRLPDWAATDGIEDVDMSGLTKEEHDGDE